MTEFISLSSSEIKVINISEQKIFNGKVFPLTLSPNGKNNSSIDLPTWLSSSQANRHEVDLLLKNHKAVLFRGFAVNSYNDFHNVVDATEYKGMEYLGYSYISFYCNNNY